MLLLSFNRLCPERQSVFGADSDATTLAIAGVLHRLQHDELPSLSLPDGIDGEASLLPRMSLHDAARKRPLRTALERRGYGRACTPKYRG